MKVALVHYHLKTGGVTTVLHRQVEAIRGSCDALVLTGDRAGAELPCKVVQIPGLGYDRPGIDRFDADRVAERILKTLSDTWPGGCDVLHIHNPTLAKNRQFLRIIKRLQQFGVNLFLQIHDFAEDGRPDVYFAENYPADCHYGVINARDAARLKGAGLTDDGLHYLPNAVEDLGRRVCSTPQALILYPVRAIRRKNLGEAILLSLYFDDGRRLAVTQPPNSAADVASYRDWMAWVSHRRLPVDFETGQKADFRLLVDCCESVVTTSIAEGYGFAFLEPWTAGKLLWGRRLGDICADFEENGIRLDGLYDRLDLPLAWIDADLFSRRWHAAVRRAVDRYGHAFEPDAVDRALERLTRAETVDYGLLSEQFQRQVLARLMGDPSAKADLAALNPWLSRPPTAADSSETIENNRRAVLWHYGTRRYRERLLAIYDQVVGRRVSQRIDKLALRDAFFDLDHFPLLKWSAYEKL